MPKTSLIHRAVSIEHRVVTDKHRVMASSTLWCNCFKDVLKMLGGATVRYKFDHCRVNGVYSKQNGDIVCQKSCRLHQAL